MGLWNLCSSSTSTIFISIVTLYKLLNLWEDSTGWLPGTKNIILTTSCKEHNLLQRYYSAFCNPISGRWTQTLNTARTLWICFLFFLQDAPAYILHPARNKASNSFSVLCLTASVTGEKTNYSVLWTPGTQENLNTLLNAVSRTRPIKYKNGQNCDWSLWPPLSQWSFQKSDLIQWLPWLRSFMAFPNTRTIKIRNFHWTKASVALHDQAPVYLHSHLSSHNPSCWALTTLAFFGSLNLPSSFPSQNHFPCLLYILFLFHIANVHQSFLKVVPDSQGKLSYLFLSLIALITIQ